MSVLETMRDLTDDEVIKDAEHELVRAETVEQLAAWARKWGGASIQALRDLVHLAGGDLDQDGD
jgi:hypothetical protein